MNGDGMRHLFLTKNLSVFYVALIIVLGWPAQRVSAAVIRLDEACSLHDAIVAANTDSPAGGCPAGSGADTIVLTDDVTLSEALPVIESVIAIEGGGFSISGDKRYLIFRVGEWPYGNTSLHALSRLTTNRLVLKDARGDLGSALYIASGAEVRIFQSQVADNYARDGGAIFNWGNLKIVESTLSNNLASDSGGAIKNHGSAKLAVTISTFKNNVAGNKGGAIFSSGPASVESSSFVRNAALEGGAIYSDEDKLAVANSTFSHNIGADAGGAIHLHESAATLSHLTIYGNESRHGGGVFRDGGSVSLVNSIIGGSLESADCVGARDENHGNLIQDGSCEPAFSGSPLLQPLSGSPAHFSLYGDSPAIHSGEVEYCAVWDQAGERRDWRFDCDIGAIEMKEDLEHMEPAPETASPADGTTCTLADQIHAANRDEAVGACPAGDGADTIRIEQDISLTERLPKITSEILIIGNGHTISGEYKTRIFDIGESGQLTIHNLNIIRGRHAIQGGAIRLLGGSLKICDSTIRDSHSGYGGAIYVEHGTLEIDESELSGNSAHFSGGAISSDDAAFAINNSVINKNVARGGGAISAWDGTMSLVGSTVSHNSSHYGGAIYAGGERVDAENPTEDNTFAIVRSTISHNSATRFGGAINSSAKMLRLSDSTFSNNQAGEAGGAVIIVRGAMLIEKSSFIDNSAEDDGGAIYSESADNMDIANSTFSGNSAEEGGALVVSDSSTLTHVTIADNVANEAGGISMFSGVNLRNSIVSGNRGGDCDFRSEYVQRIDIVASLIGDGSCDADLSGDPMLGDLVEANGFRPLLHGSPAIDAADPRFCPPTDQVGTPRPKGAGCDLGAIEFMGE